MKTFRILNLSLLLLGQSLWALPPQFTTSNVPLLIDEPSYLKHVCDSTQTQFALAAKEYNEFNKNADQIRAQELNLKELGEQIKRINEVEIVMYERMISEIDSKYPNLKSYGEISENLNTALEEQRIANNEHQAAVQNELTLRPKTPDNSGLIKEVKTLESENSQMESEKMALQNDINKILKDVGQNAEKLKQAFSPENKGPKLGIVMVQQAKLYIQYLRTNGVVDGPMPQINMYFSYKGEIDLTIDKDPNTINQKKKAGFNTDLKQEISLREQKIAENNQKISALNIKINAPVTLDHLAIAKHNAAKEVLKIKEHNLMAANTKVENISARLQEAANKRTYNAYKTKLFNDIQTLESDRAQIAKDIQRLWNEGRNPNDLQFQAIEKNYISIEHMVNLCKSYDANRLKTKLEAEFEEKTTQILRTQMSANNINSALQENILRATKEKICSELKSAQIANRAQPRNSQGKESAYVDLLTANKCP
jgi:hypothetical protein